MPRLQAICHSSRWTFSTCGSRVWFSPIFFFFIPVQFQRKTDPLFEQAKTSGCTLANHVISERIYPNKAWSNTIPLWLLNGFCIIHLDPYNNTGRLGAIFRFPRFPCRDTTLSGWEQSFSLRADVTCTNKHSWVWCLIAKIRHGTYSKFVVFTTADFCLWTKETKYSILCKKWSMKDCWLGSRRHLT